MAGRQDPPGKGPGLMVMIGVPKDGKNGRMGPPGGDRPGAAGGGKASPEEAVVIRSDSHCIDCQNYNPQDGSCQKVDGSFDPQDACSRFFTALNDQEPDADDQSGMSDQGSDMDADDGGQAA